MVMTRIGRRLNATWLACATAVAMLPPLLDVRAQSLTYVGSTLFSTGDYTFATRTSSLYIANGLSARLGRVRASVLVPLIAQDAGWVQYSGGGMLPTGGMPGHGSAGSNRTGSRAGSMGDGGMMSRDGGGMGSHLGIGDPLARADVELVREGEWSPAIRVVGAAKAPLAAASTGFGTGKWDFGSGFAASKAMGTVFLFADATYWRLGDMPDLPLRNTVAYGVSAGRFVGSQRVSVLGSVNGSSSVLRGVAGPVQAGLAIGYHWESGRVFTVSTAVGLTRSASDVTLGAGWQLPLWTAGHVIRGDP
jgi:hypothetical protein